jgi:hypothetical protein
LRRNVGKFGKKSLKRFFLNLSILRLQSTIFEISKHPKIVNLYQDKTVCSDYTKVFKEIANKVGVETVIISGYTKQNGVVDTMSHAWCASKIDNRWYIVDPTWGSGYVDQGKFVKKVDNHYFKANPSAIIASHMPYDYMWQFLNYPLSNQEFYNGRTGINNAKKRFDYESAISKYYTLSEIEQLISSSARIKKNGVINTMISDRLAYQKSKIEYYKNVKVADYFYTVVSLYNEGISDLNKFILYRNKQFKPITSDGELKAMIDLPINKLHSCKEMLDNFGYIEDRNVASIKAIRQSLEESIHQTEVHASFVDAYLSKSKVVRERMFRKTTWL